jgi:hypothetical protein
MGQVAAGKFLYLKAPVDIKVEIGGALPATPESYDITYNGGGSTYDLIGAGLTSETSDFNFLGLGGSDFDIPTGYKINLAGNFGFIWWRVTDGANFPQANPTGAGVAVMVDLLTTDNPANIASKTQSALAGAGIGAIQSSSVIDLGSGPCVLHVQYNTSLGNISPDANQGTITGVGVTNVQGTFGQVGGAFWVAAEQLHGFWLNVTDGVVGQNQPGMPGGVTAHRVDILLADTSSQIATKVAAAVSAVTGLFAGTTGPIVGVTHLTPGPVAIDADVSGGIGQIFLSNYHQGTAAPLSTLALKAGKASRLWTDFTALNIVVPNTTANTTTPPQVSIVIGG